MEEIIIRNIDNNDFYCKLFVEGISQILINGIQAEHPLQIEIPMWTIIEKHLKNVVVNSYNNELLYDDVLFNNKLMNTIFKDLSVWDNFNDAQRYIKFESAKNNIKFIKMFYNKN